jgi:hypothetical protein
MLRGDPLWHWAVCFIWAKHVGAGNEMAHYCGGAEGPKNREAGFGPASNRLAETFSLTGYCPHPSNLSPLVQHSIHKSKFVNARNFAFPEVLKSQRSKARSQRSEVRGQKSEVRSQRSEVRSQKSEVRSQKSEIRSVSCFQNLRASRGDSARRSTKSPQAIRNNLWPFSVVWWIVFYETRKMTLLVICVTGKYSDRRLLTSDL